MIAQLNQLFVELQKIPAVSSKAYEIIRGNIFRFLLYTLLASLLAVALNFWGLKAVNAAIGCILPFIALYAISAPTALGTILIAGVISGPRHPIQQVEKVVKLVSEIIGQILFVASLFFLIVGTISLGRNFGAILIIYLCLGLLLLINIQGVRKTKFAIPLLYGYVITSLALAIGSMIPASVHVKLYGHDFFNWARISPVEKALDRINVAKIETQEQMLANQLLLIEKKIRQGQTLTTNELALISNTEALQDLKTIPSVAKETWGKVFPRKTIIIPPRSLAWQKWEVKPTTNSVVRVYNGDEFIYKSPFALKVSEIGGSDHLHNPSATPDEIRSFKFYALPAEGREIRILPLDTNVFWLEFRIESRRTS